MDGLKYELVVAALQTIIGDKAMQFRFLKESTKLSEEGKAAYARLIKIGTGESGKYAQILLKDKEAEPEKLLGKYQRKRSCTPPAEKSKPDNTKRRCVSDQWRNHYYIQGRGGFR